MDNRIGGIHLVVKKLVPNTEKDRDLMDYNSTSVWHGP